MGHCRSDVDEVQKISTSIFVTNFPDQFYAKDLWKVCNQYGNVVDAFIPNRRSKSGPQSQNVEEENKPEIVLDETCVNQQDYSTSLMGKVKEFGSLTNLKVVLANEDERVTWVDIEGIPLKVWTKNTFNRIASKWGDLLHVEDQDEGKVFWVHAKEVYGYISNFVEDDEEESDTHEIRDEELHDESAGMHNHATMEGESDVEEVSETIFENKQYQAHKKDDLKVGRNDICSEGPFNIDDLLNKKKSTLLESGMEGDECLQNIHDEKVASEVKKTCPLSNSKDDKEESICSGHLKKPKYHVVIMGDFSKVHKQAKRYGSIFNMQGADAFNSFISAACLEEGPLGGCSFIWCHKSATKMSKLDRFLISEGLMGSCPNISVITLC
ncbi:RNA-directed DNA polymerase, eukaryota, reverse transcriptase zinc-binding domain protein [Tanacetum coccineum]|uniref:RNA-directed DNA polymerase, eukaryota, reverse transcriptase zinc-binding domain protein n=1 Tax=Tanacetum coccineum TaxID=301880 RepID=A0ABQ5I3V5_9ASTR